MGKKLIFCSFILASVLFFSSSVLAGSFSCEDLKKERKIFLEKYKNKRYSEAYKGLSEFMNLYNQSETCGSKDLISQVWAYCDLSLAALKMKDPKRCFEFVYRINDLVEGQEENLRKPIKALLYNYGKSMELENGFVEASKVSCSANPENFCGEFKFMLIDKLSKENGFVKAECKDQKGAFDLTAFGRSGCLVLVHFEDKDERRVCPAFKWIDSGKTRDIKIIPAKNKDGYVENFILDDSNCCNVLFENISLKKEGSDLVLKMSGDGRDCYGGTASFYYRDLYRINFENMTMTLIDSMYIGLH